MGAVSADEIELKRLRMRSWRRGMRETDLILGRFADAELAGLTPAERAAYAALLSENDQDVYSWVSGAGKAPAPLRGIVDRLQTFHARPMAPDNRAAYS